MKSREVTGADLFGMLLKLNELLILMAEKERMPYEELREEFFRRAPETIDQILRANSELNNKLSEDMGNMGRKG